MAQSTPGVPGLQSFFPEGQHLLVDAGGQDCAAEMVSQV